MPKPGPYSRLNLSSISGRTREGAFAKGVRAELVRHVGGNPSPTQTALIEAAVMLRLRIAMMDKRFATDAATDHDSHVYLAWINSLGRLMTRLDGLKPSGKPARLSPEESRRHVNSLLQVAG